MSASNGNKDTSFPKALRGVLGCLLLLLPLSLGVERALGGLTPAPQAETAAGEPFTLPVLNTQEHVVYLEGPRG